MRRYRDDPALRGHYPAPVTLNRHSSLRAASHHIAVCPRDPPNYNQPVDTEPDRAWRAQGCHVRARAKTLLVGGALILGNVAAAPAPQAGRAKRIDLAKSFAVGKLRAVNCDVTKVPDRPDALHVSERPGPGLVWIEESDFTEGVIQVEVRGRDQFQRSFVGIAFHRKDDNTHEVVYVRPFNFRA
jgi:hypothetical protein